MVSKPKAPTPPDPTVTAQAQTGSNINTAIANGYLNATNQNTPYGSVRYDQTGSQNVGGNEVPTFTSTTSLNPQYQQLLDSQAGIGQQALNTGGLALSNAQGTLASPFSLSGLPQTASNVNIPGGVPLTAADFQKQGDATTAALMSRYNQDWDQQGAANDAKLANQGIAVGSDAYAADKRTLDQGRNDAMSQALLAGNTVQNNLFNQSLQSQNQLFGMNLQNANLNNQARQQGISEQQLQRNQPLNELATLLGFSPGIQTPNAPNFGGNVAGTDVAGITQNNFANQMAGYQQQMQQQNAAMGGLFGLGQAAILAPAFSDRRLKTDIRRVGITDDGLPIYTYRYKSGGPVQMGVMADEVERVSPEAVTEIDGYKAVYYAMVH